MGTRTARVLTAAAGAVALTWVGSGTAAAAPPEDRGTQNSTTGSANAFPLVGDAGVFLGAFDPDGEAPFAVPEVFVGRYECLTEERLPADFRGLGSVSTRGTVALVCGAEDLPEVTATLTVDVVWRGVGRATEQPEPPFPTGCDLRVLIRQAQVSGTIALDAPALGIDGTATLDGVPGDIRSALSNCAAPH
jgi:hypothetical protein